MVPPIGIPQHRVPELAPGCIALDLKRFRDRRAIHGGFCFAVENGPLGSSDTRHTAGGAIVMRSRVAGVVLDVEPEALRIRTAVGTSIVRFMVPEGVSLEGLLGMRVQVEVTHVLRHGRDPIVDATIRDDAGRLLLWGRDGGIAPDRVAHGVALRVAHAADGAPRLAVASPAGMTIVGAREHAEVLLEEGRFALLVTRVAHDEASLVCARR